MRGSSLAPRAPKHLGLKATLGALVGWGAAYAIGCDETTCLVSTGLAAVTVRIALIDLKLRIIRDRDVLALLLFSSIWTIWPSLDPAHNLTFAFLHSASYVVIFQSIRLIYFYLRGREGLGFGDVKLAAAAGPLLEIETFSAAIAVASVMGLFFTYCRHKAHRRISFKYTYVPFGCLFSIAIYGTWLVNASPE